VGGSHVTPPWEIVAQLLKRAGKHAWHPECVVRVMGGGGTAGGAMAEAALAVQLKVEVVQLLVSPWG
jgi:hypothetical protein